MAKQLELTNKVFNRLTVLKRLDKDKTGNYLWECICICGNKVIVKGSILKYGNIGSCGCARNEKTILRNKQNAKHNMTYTSEYKSWDSMKYRCNNQKCKDYKNYGGRGIKVCKEWNNSFETFYRDMGPKPSLKHSIERKNVNSDYEPGNCIWATSKIQGNNKRDSRYFFYKNEKLTMREWADKYNIPYSVLKARIYLGWSFEKSIKTPVKKYKEWHNKLYKYKDESKTLKKWSELSNIPLSYLRDRVSKGMDIEKALTLPIREIEKRYNKIINFKNISKSIEEFANIYNISKVVLANRINNGWNIEEALTTPEKLLTTKYFSYLV